MNDSAQVRHTEGNGVIVPIINDIKFVIDVIVIETAASEYVWPIRSGTLSRGFVRRHAANNTNASSIPTPIKDKIYILFSFNENY